MVREDDLLGMGMEGGNDHQSRWSEEIMAVIQEDYPKAQSFALFSFLSTLTHLVALPNPLIVRTPNAEDLQTYNFNHNPGRVIQTCVSNCLLDTSIWMPNMHLKLNMYKTGFWYYLQMSKPAPLADFPISGNGSSHLPVVQFRNLGDILDSSLSFTYCIHSIRKSCWLYLQIMSQISYFSQPFLPFWFAPLLSLS